LNAIFKVHKTFRLPSLSFFVFAGEIIQGTVKPGMKIQIVVNGNTEITVPVDRIEFIRTDGRELVALTTTVTDPQEAEMYEQLDVVGECLAVSDGA
jgi:hypothetical protein